MKRPRSTAGGLWIGIALTALAGIPAPAAAGGTSALHLPHVETGSGPAPWSVLSWLGYRDGRFDACPVFELPPPPVEVSSEDALLLASHRSPSGRRTTLVYAVPQDGPVSLVVYDLGGEPVRTLVDGPRPAGVCRVLFDGHDDAGRPLPSGPYFYLLSAAGRDTVGRITLAAPAANVATSGVRSKDGLHASQ